MWKDFKIWWGRYKNIAAAHELLEWVGWWGRFVGWYKTLGAIAVAMATAFLAYLENLPRSVQVVLALAASALFLALIALALYIVERFQGKRGPARELDFRPILKYEFIRGHETALGGSTFDAQAVDIKNIQTAVENVAGNVKARLEYTHARQVFSTEQATWLVSKMEGSGANARRLTTAATVIQLAGNETQALTFGSSAESVGVLGLQRGA